MTHRASLSSFVLLVLAIVADVLGFDISCNSNVAVYWGQNSAASGALPYQQPLRAYCDNNNVDIILLSFLYILSGTGGYPVLNFANICDYTKNASVPVFPGTELMHCSDMGSDIKYCQNKGKLILLSIGGATAQLNSDAATFSKQVWDLFMEGTSEFRPFDDAVIDGVDLDFEQSSQMNIIEFANNMNQYYKTGTKKYYLTAAPQCPYPDANLGSLLAQAHVDMAFIQFYNSGWCDNSKYGLPHWPEAMNYYMWDAAWHNSSFANPSIKLYVGATAGQNAGNPSSYVSPSFFATELQELQNNYTGSFGGAMLWDMSWAYDSNPNYAANAKQALMAGSKCNGSA
ncbi:Chitinase 2 [Coemansia spiralis]|uniref:chitinase n=2 Tax=Coemansia TaxID=4863 RepID=A0A9W8KXA5_9FUNG|nr:Chitinase 2 [Coemansia umbellata]KAJ2625360.1 Chitinase 2 [Coemansia sp. RSA 1358]KAJ2676171.1 Chitinase 2 [Coemansia spiralis]